MFGDKFNLSGFMKNYSKIKDMLEKTQEELEKIEVTGESGAGAVKVTMNAKFTVKSIEIDPEYIQPENSEILSELLISAINQAVQKAQEITQTTMMDASKLFTGSTEE